MNELKKRCLSSGAPIEEAAISMRHVEAQCDRQFRRSTLNDIQRKPGQACLLVPRLHIQARLVHRRDDLIER